MLVSEFDGIVIPSSVPGLGSTYTCILETGWTMRHINKEKDETLTTEWEKFEPVD